MLASASPDQYASCLEMLIEDARVDSVLVILPPPPMFPAESVADALIPVIDASGKPIAVALLGSELTAAALGRFSKAGVPTYPFPERAASALAALARRAKLLATADTRKAVPVRPFTVDEPPGPPISELVSAYGIQTVPLTLATSPESAVTCAETLGFPVAMKIASPDILHKSDIGGVVLNVSGPSQVTGAYTKVLRNVAATFPQAKIEGVHLQRYLPAGQDVIVGAVRDPHFGPLIMFGSGGVEAEGLKDVAFALAPLSEVEADELINRTWAGRRLGGFRNLPPADRTATREAVIRLSWLAFEHPEIREIEINPLRILDRGAWALDVRVQS
jgi:acetyltransferase